ncbi:hypothetical protein OIU78_009945 [Salix suchowensis]|nr:hypothetical protein OIU78_009945 [Salix suchowensis]
MSQVSIIPLIIRCTLTLLDLLKLNLRLGEDPHPFHFQILGKLHPLLLQIHHLLQLLTLHPLINLPKSLYRTCQSLNPFPLPVLLYALPLPCLKLLFLLLAIRLLCCRCRCHCRVIPPKITTIIHRQRPLLRQRHRQGRWLRRWSRTNLMTSPVGRMQRESHRRRRRERR